MAKRKKVLIVEDEFPLVNIIKIKLEGEGFEVLSALDGKEGLRQAQRKPDLVLLDIVMPGMDGFEVLKRLKEDSETKDIPVVILSNSGREEEIEKGRISGACDYLVKTQLSLDELVDKIRKWTK